MNNIFISILSLFITTSIIAQQGINFKAVINDDNGALVTNQKVTLKFSILQDDAKSNIYSEIHTPITDTNGIVIVNIGEGYIENGDFSQIAWGDYTYYLQTQIDTGDGLKSAGTRAFNTVPYAFQAQTATKAMNVTGLEAINEGNGTGWRLKGQLQEFYGNIGLLAVDLSQSGTPSNTYGATGAYSFATGNRSQASGLNSVAMGNNSTASGTYSFASGNSTTASGYVSTAIGNNTEASAHYSTASGNGALASGESATAMGFNTKALKNGSVALGLGTTAHANGEIAVGSYNTNYNPIPTPNWNQANRVFVVGNGYNESHRSNALTIYNNGKIAVGNISPGHTLDVDGRMRVRSPSINSTAGIWYTDSNGLDRQFAGAKKHNPYWNSARQWGIYIKGWKFWVNGDGDATLTGSLAQNSDKRLKTNITDIEYGLKSILKLKPKQYFWKDRTDQQQASLGLIAQETEKIIPNIVDTGTDEKKTLSIRYTELIPVLIKAIKEQQQIIDNQTLKINDLTLEIDQLTSLNTRVKQLENLLKTTEK